MTIKEEIQLEEYKRTFAEAYKQGFMDAMSVCKTEPQFDKDINVRSKDEPQTITIEGKMPLNEWRKICPENPQFEDEPQPFDKPPKCLGCLYSDLDKAFHPCASCVDFDKYVGEVSGKDEPQTDWHYDEQDATWYPYKHEDEPQTERSE